MPSVSSRDIFRFGPFTLDAGAYDLRRDGRSVRLERLPMDLLLLLLRRRGQLVSRVEIADLLWGKDVFVEVEPGIHTAIRKIRLALGDSVEAPQFVETVPGKGYRFVGAAGSGWPTPAPSQDIVAVLPFANLSGDPDLAPLADGLTEESIASLGQVDPARLGVVGRTSMLGYRGSAKSLAEIGRELGATYLVESSLRADADRLRVTSRLVRADTQVQVWSQSFDRERGSMLGLQDELSTAIADQVHQRLSPGRPSALNRRQTRDSRAYDLYLRGLSMARRRNPVGNRHAIELYSQSTGIDPSYALAWSALAMVQAGSLLNGDALPSAVAPRVRAASMRALAANHELAEAQFAYGYQNWLIDWNWPEAERAMRRAIALDPHYAEGPRILGHVLSNGGRHHEAAALMARARALEPLDPMGYALSSQVAFQGRDYAAALAHASRAIEIAPALWIGVLMRAQAQAALGADDEAVAALDLADTLSEGNSKVRTLRAYVLARAGRISEARDIAAALEEVAGERYLPPAALAVAYLGLGDTDRVLALLERAYEVRDVHLIYLPVDPKLDPYRAEPRFVALVQRCGFAN